MPKVEPSERGRRSGQNAASDEEIEILEIIGLDEDSPPLGAAETKDGDPREDSGGYFLDLDEASDETAAPVPPAAPADPEADLPIRESLVRLQADFENYKKRVEREQEEFQKHASSGLVRRLLPVLDNFERAVSAATSPDAADALRDGLILIFKQMLDELRKEGLAAVDSVGQTFDPNVHEAVATDHASGLPSNTVVEELQRGYLLYGRLLRPALVKVSTGEEGTNDQPDGG